MRRMLDPCFLFVLAEVIEISDDPLAIDILCGLISMVVELLFEFMV